MKLTGRHPVLRSKQDFSDGCGLMTFVFPASWLYHPASCMVPLFVQESASAGSPGFRLDSPSMAQKPWSSTSNLCSALSRVSPMDMN